MRTFERDWTIHNDAMLSNVRYYDSKKDGGFVVIWKDLTTSEKNNNVEIIVEPEVPVYFVKPEFRQGHNKYVMPLDRLDRKFIQPSMIPKIIAQEIGPQGVRLYQNAVMTHDWRAMKQLFKWPYSFGADYPPEMFYRIWWKEHCETKLSPYVKQAFSDIEVDIIGAPSATIDQMLEQGNYPINIISIYYRHENQMHIYAMIPDGKMGGDLANDQLKAYVYMRENWDGFMREIHDIFDRAYGNIDYKFHWYRREDELKMIIDYFVLTNKLRPDFVGFWNMSFDMPYTMSRCQTLGADPKDVICDPEFPIQELRFKKDTRHFGFKESGDFLYSSTVPLYTCLMRNYAKHRKQMLFQSYSLDAISEYELGEHKLKYGDDGTTIRDLAYRDYRKFILYNIKDTLLTKQIDKVTGDLEYTWIVSNTNYTNYDQIFSPSLSLRCIVYDEFMRQAIGEY